MSTQSVTDGDFENSILNSKGLVLVDFWAEWCGPCRALGPKLEEIANEMNGKVEIRKLNIDENPQSPAKYGVRGIPTMILFKDGQLTDRLDGNQPKEDIVSMIEKYA